ncbi:MAG TPA: ATP-binding cassette domain-containing protein [Gammaproteobacteria bacterium]|nr:ATP-binding cassette domain-containing protein [Gammaproteobacteria bacterium]
MKEKQAVTVEAQNVDYTYGKGSAQRQVLAGNNFTLFAGEIVVMTGPSGSGKTTLLTLIGALRAIQGGNIQVMGQSLGELSSSQRQKLRKNIGFIFQDHNLFESMSARQTLELTMQLFRERYTAKERKSRPVEMLEKLGLGERLESKPDNLSTGQKQRVAIGRALINNPQLILADEPTAALDKGSGEKVMQLLRQRADEEQACILIVTHDPRILGTADRIIEMMDGQILKTGAST